MWSYHGLANSYNLGGQVTDPFAEPSKRRWLPLRSFSQEQGDKAPAQAGGVENFGAI